MVISSKNTGCGDYSHEFGLTGQSGCRAAKGFKVMAQIGTAVAGGDKDKGGGGGVRETEDPGLRAMGHFDSLPQPAQAREREREREDRASELWVISTAYHNRPGCSDADRPTCLQLSCESSEPHVIHVKNLRYSKVCQHFSSCCVLIYEPNCTCYGLVHRDVHLFIVRTKR